MSSLCPIRWPACYGQWDTGGNPTCICMLSREDNRGLCTQRYMHAAVHVTNKCHIYSVENAQKNSFIQWHMQTRTEHNLLSSAWQFHNAVLFPLVIQPAKGVRVVAGNIHTCTQRSIYIYIYIYISPHRHVHAPCTKLLTNSLASVTHDYRVAPNWTMCTRKQKEI